MFNVLIPLPQGAVLCASRTLALSFLRGLLRKVECIVHFSGQTASERGAQLAFLDLSVFR